jgi:hypothetical protein
VFSVEFFHSSVTVDCGFLCPSVKGARSVFSSLTANEFPDFRLSPLFSARKSGAILQSFGPKPFKISKLEATPSMIEFSVFRGVFSVRLATIQRNSMAVTDAERYREVQSGHREGKVRPQRTQRPHAEPQ